jgi:hypothetical protein
MAQVTEPVGELLISDAQQSDGEGGNSPEQGALDEAESLYTSLGVVTPFHKQRGGRRCKSANPIRTSQGI